jgi:hypothetical protein
VLLVLAVLVVGAAAAQAPNGERPDGEMPAEGSLSVPPAPTRGAPSGPSGPGLDALLQLPRGYGVQSGPRVAGTSEAEWRRRFAKARQELTTAEQQLAETKRELDEEAGSGGASQWAVAPPGASNSGGGAVGPNNSPVSFRLRQALRSQREEVEQKKRALRDLGIEADLAGVPPGWRGVTPSSSEPSTPGPEAPPAP